ncbi:MAG: SusC/RagA family TonB-linked outer membrane protein, partial [Fermentimonas sp.]
RVSYVGMRQQDVKVGKNTNITITLVADTELLDEVVVVGYGTQRRSDLTTAVSSVSGKDLMKAPAMSVSNMVGTRVSGISAVQSSGQPGADQAALRVRGQGGIVYVIDGVRRTVEDFNGIDPNEIESITVLKDASSVAVYGLDANGAFIVTTKKGDSNKTSISYTGTVGYSNNAEQQRWLDGPEYAYWYNKARVMQGDGEVFTTEMVRKMREGIDGWGNTNWYKKIMGGTGARQHHNLSASGGNDKLRFFTSIGYLNEKGNIDNYNFQRYNVRSNINAKIANDITLSLGISGRLDDRNEPRFPSDPDAYSPIQQQVIRMLPYMAEKKTFEGKEYDVATNITGTFISPYAAINDAGYNKEKRVNVQTDFMLKYDAPWLKGLSLEFQGAFDMNYGMTKLLSKPYDVMVMVNPIPETKELSYQLRPGINKNTASLYETAVRRYNITSQTKINYHNKFGRHSVGALLLAETRESNSNNISASGYGLDFVQLDELSKITNLTGDGETKIPVIGGGSAQSRVAGFVGRINYNYADRYYFEGSLRRDGSYLFGGMNKRWVTLPGASIAWRASNEEWFDAKWIDNLKLRAGIGKTATSGVRPFQWENTMAINSNSVVLGDASQSSIYPSVLGNPNLTWSQCMNYNIGMDATLWGGLLGIEADVFYKYEYDKLSSVTGSYPPSMGKYYFSTGNVDELDYKGFDLTLTHYNKIGSVNYGVKLIWSYAYGRWLKYAGDSEDAPEYRRRTGKQIGAKLGLIAEGLFQSEQEIEDSPTFSDRPARVGYIKYKDLNGDGKITLQQDQGYFGRSSIPLHTGSVNLFGNWNGFDVDILFSFGLKSSVSLTGQTSRPGITGAQIATSYSRPFYGGGNSPLYLVANAWTPENPDAEFPRLEVTPLGGGNNNMSSSFWYKSGDYLRLKSMQIGYSFPQKLFAHMNIESLRVFTEGFNLFTWSAVSKFNIDPESPAVNDGYYPQQRKYTIGLKVTF